MRRSVTYAIIAFFFVACEYASVEDVQFEKQKQDWVFPLFTTQLEFSDMLNPEDDEMIEYVDAGDGHQTVQIVHREAEIVKISANDVFAVPDMQGFSSSSMVGERTISNEDIEPMMITLEDIDNQSNGSLTQMGLFGAAVVVPESSGLPGAEKQFSELENLEWAVVESATAQIVFTNNTPLPAQVSLELKNAGDASVIELKTVPSANSYLAPGEVFNLDISNETNGIAGKRIEGKLIARIVGWKTSGSGNQPVLLSKTDGFKLEAKIQDLVLREGSVKLSEQQVESQDYVATFGEGDMQLHEVKFTGAQAQLNFSSDIAVDAKLTLSFPNTRTSSGEILTDIQTLHFSQNQNQTVNVSLANTTSSLSAEDTQNPGQYLSNSLPVHAAVTILPTSGYVYFHKDNQISVNSSFSNVSVDYIKGYLGTHNFNITPDYFDIQNDLFDKLSGSVTLKDPKFNLLVKNQGVGFPVALDFMVTRDNSQNLNREIIFEPAPVMGELHEQTVNIANTQGQSDLSNLLSIPLSRLSYSGSADINRGMSSPLPADQYFKGDAQISIGAEIELPLYIELNNLAFRDKVELSLEDMTDAEEHLESVTLQAYVKNGFPMNVALVLVFEDENELPVFTLPGNTSERYAIPAAQSQDGVAVVGQEGVSSFGMEVNQDMISKLERVRYVEIIAYMANGNESAAKLYTDYKIDVNLGMRGKVNTDLDFE